MRVVNPLEILLVTCLNEYILFSNFYFSFAENNKKPLLSKKERFFY